MRIAFAVLLLAMSNLFGCAAPLAETNYPIVTDASMEGTWKLEPRVSVGALAGDGSGQRQDFLLTFGRTAHGTTSGPVGSPSALTASQFRTANPGPEQRYTISFGEPLIALNSQPPQEILEGQLIRSGTRTLLTVQPTTTQALSSAAWAIPIQQTFRLDRDGDTVRVLKAKADLIWVPVPMSGEFIYSPPQRADSKAQTRRLAKTADQVFAYLESLPDEDWEWVATAMKVR